MKRNPRDKNQLTGRRLDEMHRQGKHTKAMKGRTGVPKKALVFLLIFSFLMGYPVEMFAQELKTTTNLRLRLGASADTPVLEVIPKGTAVEILNTTGNWAGTKYNGGGYLGLKFLEASDGTLLTRVTTNLKLRSGPSTKYSVRAVIPKGTEVPVIEREGNFIKTVWNGNVGWLGVKYTEAMIALPQREVLQQVNLRSGPGTSYAILDKLRPGTRLSVISHSGGWIRTAINGKIGWLTQNYTKTVNEHLPRISTAEISFQAAPDTGSAIVSVIPSGLILPVYKDSGDWINTSFEGRNGWILREGTNELAELPQRETTSGLNMRRGAGTGFSVIETLPKGTQVPVIKQSGDWVYSWYNGNGGWLSRSSLKFLSDPSRPDSPPAGLMDYSNARHDWSHAYPEDSNYGYPELGGAYRYHDGKVYLTFDYGWENGLTLKFLDTLDSKGIKSIMYVTGYYLRTEPDLVRRMISDGHIVANHSDKHPDTVELMETSMQAVYDDLRVWEAEYRGVVGSDPEVWYYRPPSGIFSERVMGLLNWMGYKTELWDVAILDWDVENQMEEEKALQSLMAQTKPGSIVLLHAVSTTNEKILGQYIDAIRDKGWEIGNPHELGDS